MNRILRAAAAVILAAALGMMTVGCNIFNLVESSTPYSELPGVNVLTPPPGSITYTTDPNGQTQIIIARNGYSVSTSNVYATAIAADVLESGGNAVDAAIAAAYMLTVVEPYGSGIGGGGGMTIYDPVKNEYKFLNYLAEAAPSGSRHLNIGVPGFVSGMQTAYDMYGTKLFSELLQPAIYYAENGYTVDEDLFYRIQNARGSFSSSSTPYAYLQQAGDVLVQTEAAEVLKTIANEGSASFYTGSIAESIARATGMSMSDLAGYETIVSDAVIGDFAGYTVASASAPFSGVTLIQMLKLCEILELPDPDEDPAGYLSTLSNVAMACESDRYKMIGDPRFISKPIDYQSLLTNEYVCELMNLDYSDFQHDDEGYDTTHISVVDTNGMAVSATNTLTQFFGSKLYVNGFFLNNALRNFATSSSGKNAYAPGKRTRSYMCPTILRKDNGEIFAIGTPGGTAILSVMTTVLTDNIMFGTPMQDAVNKRRIIIKSLYALYYEDGSTEYPLVVNPNGLGYYAVPMSLDAYFGSINCAGYSPSLGYFATADYRRLGSGRAVNR